MPITQSYLNFVVLKGKEAAVTALAEYTDGLKKGKTCRDDLFEIGVLLAVAKAIEGYELGAPGQCLNDTAAETIMEIVEEIAQEVNNKPISFDTFFLLQEDGFDLLQEDGFNILWI
jgi:hypothetical protein